VLIADDEPLARQRLRRLLRREAEVEIVAECGDGPGTVAALLANAPDLLFLDVQMPELDGFAVLRAIPADRIPVTIFVTAYDRYALQAFEARALDYLLKPFTETRFRAAFERARAAVLGAEPGERARLLSLLEQLRLEQRELRTLVGSPEQPPSDRLLVREEGRVHVLPLGRLDFVEAQDDYLVFAAAGKRYRKQQTLAELEAQLDPARFVRIHRSYLLHVERLARLELYAKDSWLAILADGTKLPVSRSGHARLKELLG